MRIVQIPVEALSGQALDGLLEEFVTRDGTDYGAEERTLDDKKSAVPLYPGISRYIPVYLGSFFFVRGHQGGRQCTLYRSFSERESTGPAWS